METLIGTILGVALAWVFGAIVLMIVSRLGLGLSVDGFVPAIIASAVISIVAGVIIWALGFFGISVGGPGFLGPSSAWSSLPSSCSSATASSAA